MQSLYVLRFHHGILGLWHHSAPSTLSISQECKFTMLDIRVNQIGEKEAGPLIFLIQGIDWYMQVKLKHPTFATHHCVCLQVEMDRNFDFVAGYLATFLDVEPSLPRKVEVEDCTCTWKSIALQWQKTACMCVHMISTCIHIDKSAWYPSSGLSFLHHLTPSPGDFGTPLQPTAFEPLHGALPTWGEIHIHISNIIFRSRWWK